MDDPEYTNATTNDIKVRVKDAAARAFVMLREGVDEDASRFAPVDPKLFDPLEPDEKKRDAQIDDLKKWYADNKARLDWDSTKNRLVVKKE